MDYKQLIKTDRIRASGRGALPIADEAESDRARVLFSAPFRRLQQKAQVFSLEDNAAVRSRLTHSLEVAHNGRHIARTVLGDEPFVDSHGLAPFKEPFVTIAETACLLHDIGNPPFGHFGEAAIRQWFQTHYESLATQALGKAALNAEPIRRAQPDFTRFDGNAQGLRIITKLQYNIDEHGLNLTASQIAAYLKYIPESHKVDDGKQFHKKPGYFSTERAVIDDVDKLLGFTERRRHPIVYIMEAADDISYSLSDIEDGLEKRLFDERFVKDSLASAMKAGNASNWWVEKLQKEETDFFRFKTELTRGLCVSAAKLFINNHRKIEDGTAPPILEHDDEVRKILKAIKKFAIDNVYSSREAENIELAGYKVICGLLDSFEPLLTLKRPAWESVRLGKRKHEGPPAQVLDLEQRLYRLLPEKFIKAYDAALQQRPVSDDVEWIHRVHLVVDYITGMTDNFSLETYQRLMGIKV